MSRYRVVSPPPVGGGYGVYDAANRWYVAQGLTEAEAERECEHLMESARRDYEAIRGTASEGEPQ